MPLFRALAKNMAASYFGKKAPYGFVMEVTLLYVFILWSGVTLDSGVTLEEVPSLETSKFSLLYTFSGSYIPTNGSLFV